MKTVRGLSGGAGIFLSLMLAHGSVQAALPEVNIAQGPLFSGSGNVHPNLLLDLSVEFPTVGAAYRGVSDYAKTTTYLGYFNPGKCYSYPATAGSGSVTTSSTTSSTNTTSSSVTGAATVTNSSTANSATSSGPVSGTTVNSTGAGTTTVSGLTTTVSTPSYAATPVTTTTVTDTVSLKSAAVAAVWTATPTSGTYTYYTSIPPGPTTVVAVQANFNSSTGVISGTTRYRCTSGTCPSGNGRATSSTVYYQAGTATNTVAAAPATYNHTPTTTTSVATTTVTTTTNVATTNFTDPDLSDETGYFSIAKDADANHECGGDSFSGNFMNWASSSSIDMLRYAMTGGDRIIDTTDTTVLQRAFLRNVGGTFYADGTYFPRKSVTASASMSAPNQVTPFNTPTLYVVSCRNRILFSNTAGGATNAGGTGIASDCDTPRKGGTPLVPTRTDKYFGEYLTRVKVCDSNEGPTRTDLCSKYGANYKPEGDLQKKSDKLRVGVLGYLTDTDTANSNLYGGVVRGPVKYVGPKKFDAPAFSELANDKLEWNATTGVFYTNPENTADRSSATTNSGVINYLNKFGRTNPAKLGQYKSNDPIGELYYESIRYLQGKQPTPEAISALGSATTDDNFPVVKTWTDPVTASCQANYIVTIGDVNTHYDRYIPGNTRSMNGDVARSADSLVAGVTPALNVMTQSKKVGDMEADAGGTFGNSLPRTGLANLDTLDTGAGGHGTYYMAGLAYWAHTNDIRLDKPVRVTKTYAIDVDEGGNGSIEDANPRGTKPRNSQLYLAAKYGGFLDKKDIDGNNADANPYKTYASDGKTIVTNNSEWATNGTDPDTYFLASNPEKLISAIHNIFTDASTNSGTISGVTLTSTKISTESSFVYQPGFDSSKWSGSLLKLELKLVDNAPGNASDPGHVPNMIIKIQDTKSAAWDAGTVLTGKTATTIPVAAAVAPNPAPADRKIYTAKVEADRSLTTVEFKWANLTDEQKTLLNTSPVSPYADDGLGQKRVDYLRGSRVDEIGFTNGVFRQRDRVLGDIINSNPTYVAAPSSSIQGENYNAFYEANKNRTAAVYVGANDGMMHAFSADDGRELFSYVPNALMSNLNQLTNPNYVHRPFVDGSLSINEALVSGTWKSILASGMGGGAQGIFVLDVTNPANFSSGLGAIWEFTDKDDADMGNLTSPPLVAKFKTGGTILAPIYKYFVVISSGFNNYKDDGASNFGGTDAGFGALFLLSLDKAPGTAWSLGTNYYKFKTPPVDSTLQNGLSTPALIAGPDGAIKLAYAGDLQGNVWRFNFSGAAPWSAALPDSSPFFTAKDKDGVRQPITQQPKVVFAPGGGYVVFFGTGKYIENADLAPGNFKTQSFYGVYDTPGIKNSVRANLEKRTPVAYTTGGRDALTITGNTFTYGVETGNKQGWYLDFLNSGTVGSTLGTGERSVTNSLVANGNLFFNSLVTGSDPCAKGGGRIYAVDALTGLPFNGSVTGDISGVGIPSSPVLLNISTDVTERDSIGKRVVTKKSAIASFGTGGKDGTGAISNNFSNNMPAGRNSWREVINYQELRDAVNNK